MIALRHILAFLPFPLIFMVVSPLFGGPAFAGHPTIHGYWATERYASVVEIKPCETGAAQICGSIVWLWDGVDAQGQPVTDAENPDPDLRRRPLLGREILSGQIDPAAARTAANGNIYNPEDGRTYRATLRLIDDDTLHVKGCVLFICQTQVWRRSASLPRFEDPRV